MNRTSSKRTLKRDQRIVELFLSGYNSKFGSKYRIKDWPDQRVRNKPAVDAIAVDEARSLAIEHTLLQPFVGERKDSDRFNAVVAPLENDQELLIPNFEFLITVEVGAIPGGVDWGGAYRLVRSWLGNHLRSLPEGPSSHSIQGLPFELKFLVEKNHDDLPDFPGALFVLRFAPADSLDEVMRTALSRKLPKLVETPTDKHFLLLEKSDILHGYVRAWRAIETLRPEFPRLKDLDCVWVANTVGWVREGYLSFSELWPNVNAARFAVNDDAK